MSDDRIAFYANPDKLVTTAWVAENLGREDVRVVESDEDVLLYDMGHIPGAVKIDWHTDLQHPLQTRLPTRGPFRGPHEQEGHLA